MKVLNDITLPHHRRRSLSRWVLLLGVLLLSFPSITFSMPPDTGQMTCYNDSGSEITCPQPGEPFYGQDAQYGINPQSYTKLDENGDFLPDTAATWVMVRDNVTGLIWEVKNSRDGTMNFNNPHDADNQYNCHDCGFISVPGGPDVLDFTNELNAAHFGGYSDWRLPTIKEISFIRNLGTDGQAINENYFPNVGSYYWSSTLLHNGPFSWIVDFNNGGIFSSYEFYSSFIRAVRGEDKPYNFIDNGDGTVTDTQLGLMWEVKTTDNRNDTYTWQDALSYCENLFLAGYSDWRLPDVNELQFLVDYSRYGLVIDTEYFPNTVDGFYWSSTTSVNAYSPDRAWVIDFHGGHTSWYRKSDDYYVRAVRGGMNVTDSDADGIFDSEDNCPNNYNPNQEDDYPLPNGNGIPDACDCEGNFDCDEDCDGTDASTFKVDFGRSTFDNPCINSNPCNGDFDCDGDCDGTDAAGFKIDFGRSSFNDPCPACEVGEWCVYP